MALDTVDTAGKEKTVVPSKDYRNVSRRTTFATLNPDAN